MRGGHAMIFFALEVLLWITFVLMKLGVAPYVWLEATPLMVPYAVRMCNQYAELCTQSIVAMGFVLLRYGFFISALTRREITKFLAVGVVSEIIYLLFNYYTLSTM